MPASLLGQVIPVNIDIAPPCEKPPFDHQLKPRRSVRREEMLTEYYPIRRNTLVDLSFNEAIEVVARLEYAWLIMCLCEVTEVSLVGWYQSKSRFSSLPVRLKRTNGIARSHNIVPNEV